MSNFNIDEARKMLEEDYATTTTFELAGSLDAALDEVERLRGEANKWKGEAKMARAVAAETEEDVTRLRGLLREWYEEERFDADDCSCDSMTVCEGTCLLKRTLAALKDAT